MNPTISKNESEKSNTQVLSSNFFRLAVEEMVHNVKKITFEVEDKCLPPFFKKQKISIEKGEGVYVWDEEGKIYIDFTNLTL